MFFKVTDKHAGGILTFELAQQFHLVRDHGQGRSGQGSGVSDTTAHKRGLSMLRKDSRMPVRLPKKTASTAP